MNTSSKNSSRYSEIDALQAPVPVDHDRRSSWPPTCGSAATSRQHADQREEAVARLDLQFAGGGEHAHEIPAEIDVERAKISRHSQVREAAARLRERGAREHEKMSASTSVR